MISVSSCPARPTNGSPCTVLVAPGALADEHEPRLRVADAEDEVGAVRRRACSAGSRRWRRAAPRASRRARAPASANRSRGGAPTRAPARAAAAARAPRRRRADRRAPRRRRVAERRPSSPLVLDAACAAPRQFGERRLETAGSAHCTIARAMWLVGLAALVVLLLAGRRARVGTRHPPGARLASPRAALASWPRPFKKSSREHRLAVPLRLRRRRHHAGEEVHAQPLHALPLLARRLADRRSRARASASRPSPTATSRTSRATCYSHNHFVPVQLVVSFEARDAAPHLLGGALRRRAAPRPLAADPRRCFEHRYPDCDRLVERVVERTLFSFRTNKRIFDSVMALQQARAVAAHGPRASPRARAIRCRRARSTRFNDALHRRRSRTSSCTGRRSACQHADPTGRDALARADGAAAEAPQRSSAAAR